MGVKLRLRPFHSAGRYGEYEVQRGQVSHFGPQWYKSRLYLNNL